MKTTTLIAAIAALLPAAALASVSSSSANGVILPDGPTVGYLPNFFHTETNTVQAWNEVQNFTLTQNLIVDESLAGTYNGSDHANAIISAGTIIDSQMIDFNPESSSHGVATFTFDGPVLGVIYDNGTKASGTSLLFQSDYLIPSSIPTANIPTKYFSYRGLESQSNNMVSFSGDQVTVNTYASNPGDQIRVITAAQAAPEPSSFGALAVAATGFFSIRKRARS